MSPERKIDDGNGSGRDVGIAEGRNPDVAEEQVDSNATPEEPEKSDRVEEEKAEKPESGQDTRLSPKLRRAFASARQVSESDDKNRYLITYADLITLLLGLFIILYAISNIDLNKYKKMMNVMGSIFGNAKVEKVQQAGMGIGEKSKNTASPLQQLKTKIGAIVNDYHLGDSFKILDNKRGVTLRIQEKVIFPSGKATLNKSFKTVLLKVARVLRNIKNDIRIEGHTDNVPIKSKQYPSNWHLSVARALNTAYFLITQGGLNPDKVSIVGYSEYRPIASNATPEGRAQNRRVDIVIIK